MVGSKATNRNDDVGDLSREMPGRLALKLSTNFPRWKFESLLFYALVYYRLVRDSFVSPPGETPKCNVSVGLIMDCYM